MMVLSSFLHHSFNTKIPSILLGIFALVMIGFSQGYMRSNYERPKQLVAPPAMIHHMAFGFNEVMADSLWIRSLQDFDYCENQLAEHLCAGSSWLYQMLDATTNLSPKFRIAYSSGALALTIIISDYEGASKLFDKGVKEFPNDWPLLYRAGYHFLYETSDKKKAADLFKRAADNGAPPWLYNLAGRLYSDSGNLDVAEKLLEEMIKTEQDPGFIERLRQKIQSVKKNAQ